MTTRRTETDEVPGPPPNRTTRKRELTRRKLVDAGRIMITERGVAGLRIQALTERADVGLGSFYNHFSSKEALVEAIVSESLAELAAATIPVTWHDEDPRGIAAGALLRFVRLADEYPGFARLVVNLSNAESLFGPAVHPYARTVLERGVAEGRFRLAGMEVALSVTIGGAFALIREVLEGRHAPDAAEAFTCHSLLSFGVPFDEALEVTRRTLAAIDRAAPLPPPGFVPLEEHEETAGEGPGR